MASQLAPINILHLRLECHTIRNGTLKRSMSKRRRSTKRLLQILRVERSVLIPQEPHSAAETSARALRFVLSRSTSQDSARWPLPDKLLLCCPSHLPRTGANRHSRNSTKRFNEGHNINILHPLLTASGSKCRMVWRATRQPRMGTSRSHRCDTVDPISNTPICR